MAPKTAKVELSEAIGINISFTATDDVPLVVARALHESDLKAGAWGALETDRVRDEVKRIKSRLARDAVPKMTLERLRHTDGDGEIEGWLRRIAKMLS